MATVTRFRCTELRPRITAATVASKSQRADEFRNIGLQDPAPYLQTVRFFANRQEAQASESAQGKGTGTCSHI